MPRQGEAVRQGFTARVRGMVARLAGLLPEGKRREDAALAAAATLIGTLVLARAVDDPVLSDRILAAGRDAVSRSAEPGPHPAKPAPPAAQAATAS
ncbi:MAG: hypothetical protein KGL52_03855 [Rhodospirillales bacterium]|nr:hypothetical protein [Rhodospirillales bacterium]